MTSANCIVNAMVLAMAFPVFYSLVMLNHTKKNVTEPTTKKAPIVLLDPNECPVKTGSRAIRRVQVRSMRKILESLDPPQDRPA
ncbi:hypothetical protein KKF55_00255 [Patescibacteria group bacterium]|nr:hypothetical protein [Patescibacteria group bacterium]